MLILEIDGQNYEGVIDISSSKSMETISGTFTCSVPNVSNVKFPIKLNSRAKIKGGIGNVLLDGYVDIIRVSYASGSHVLVIRGRDLTSDIVDSTVKGNIAFKSDISLQDVITQTIGKIGLNLPIKNEAGEIPKFEETEFSTAKVAENMFSFLEAKCRQKQVLLSTDGRGSLVLRKGGTYTKIDYTILNELGGENNIILSSDVSYNSTKRFNEYKALSQGNTLFEGEDATLVEKQGTAIDDEIRSTRYLEFKPEKLSGNLTAEERAKYEANMRRTRALTYNCTVRGHTYDGENFWDINTLVHVKDDFAFIDADLLLKDITFNYSNNSGSTTDLTFVSKDSYLALPNKTIPEKKMELTQPTEKKEYVDYGAYFRASVGGGL